jgi:hypothetical protein
LPASLRAAKGYFGGPDFRSCAIADDIREILAARQAPPFAVLAPARASPQLTLTGPAPP